MIDPGGIPTIPGDMDALVGHAAALRGVGSDFAATGQRINSTWQGLGGVYQAPEVGQLLAATAPVQAISVSVGGDLGTVAGTLASYAAEVRQIQAELASLRSQAGEFVASVAGDDDWTSDGGKVDRNNQLISAVNAQMAAFFDAQRRCANAINALYGGPQYRADNGDGQLSDGEYGYTADQLNAAAGQDRALPWGKTEEKDRGVLGDIGAFLGGVKDAAVGCVTGLGALIGRDPATGEWSWATAGTAWKGLGTLVVAAGVYAVPGGRYLDQDIGIPGFERGQLGNTLLSAGKSIIAYDEWGQDPARAAGMATCNVVTAVLGTKGAGAGLRATGAAAEGSRIAAVSRAGTVMVRTGEAIGNLPTVSDLARSVGQRIPGLHLPNLADTTHINIPHHTDIPTPRAHVDLPVGHPRADLPETAPRPGSIGDALSHTHIDLPAHTPHTEIPGHHADVPTPHPDRPLDSDVAPADHALDDPSPGPQSHGEDANDPHSPGSSSADMLPEQLGNQSDGSWVNVEHGTRFDLTPEQNAAADQYLARARADEPHISPQVNSIADNIDGGRLQGYPDYVIKSEDSFKRKFAGDLERYSDHTQEEVLAAIKDSVRYTVEIPHHHYTDDVVRSARELRSRGFENVTFKPTWGSPETYKGVNSAWRDPATGRVFELQFHTPDSFSAKMQTHELYEAERAAKSELERQRAADAQAAIFRKVDIPDHAVERLDELKRELDAERAAAAAPEPRPHTADVTPDHVSDTHSHGPHHDQPADPGVGDPIHTTPDDAADWSTVLGTTDVNAQPAIHSGTATAEQARHYVAENHPYVLDVNADRHQRGIPGSDQNCSRCVYAVDNGFAHGAPTSALPWPEGPGWGVADNDFNDYARMLGADPADMRGVPSYDDIIKDMTARGEGARGMVYISRPGPPPSAHVFNVVHDQNGVVFLDGQTGGLGVLEKNVDIAYLPIGG